ncbi:hypothetical protein DE146DRAFT_393029 [Phaeosphaeria sp. MPI-PUGE-AT-0046c]|nr:hypothetical protein DE146DRAFT_393029 [Phaeosphaeria sp. MPI-PUGE-AT-0046c]
MADYEELVELGFEGVDKFANKYHDTVYEHLPAWRRKQKRQQEQASQNQHQQQKQQQRKQPAAANEPQRSREVPEEDHDETYPNDDMSSYAQSQYAPYADRGQDYRGYPDARDARYVQEETSYRRSPNAGAIVMRDREAYADRSGYDKDPRDISPQRNNGYGYDDRQVRTRPAPNRMRSTSWSPPRDQRYDEDGSRRRRRSRSRSRPSSRDEDGWHKGRIAATLVGGLLGGVAGNRFTKGQKFDTAATVGGAVLGGIASSEIAERFERKKDEKRRERDRDSHGWEEKHGDGGRYDNDRRRSRGNRDGDWCDRCRCDISRCRCR